MATGVMLTTVDNPYNPFEDFANWYLWDMQNGYDCCGRLANLYREKSEMTNLEVEEAVEQAIDTIIKNDFTNLFVKVDEKHAKEIVKDSINFRKQFEQEEKS